MMHRMGLQKMIALTGGWCVLHQRNAFLTWCIIGYVHIALCPWLHMLALSPYARLSLKSHGIVSNRSSSALNISKPKWFRSSPSTSPLLDESPSAAQVIEGSHKTVSRKLKASCELTVGVFRDLQALMMTNLRGAHSASLAGYTWIKVALSLLRNQPRFPKSMQTESPLACIEECGRLPCIFYIAILIRDYLQQLMTIHSLIQETNTILKTSKHLWNDLVLVLFVGIFKGCEKPPSAPAFDRLLYVYNIMEVVKQLSWDPWTRTKETLLDILATFLDDDDHRQSVSVAVELLDSGRLLQEIRGASRSSWKRARQYPHSDESQKETDEVRFGQ
jgi:hypothetical protein